MRVAFVAPSLGILGGQAVQADRLLQAWTGDTEVRAWLVPVNPVFPRALRFTTHHEGRQQGATALLLRGRFAWIWLLQQFLGGLNFVHQLV